MEEWMNALKGVSSGSDYFEDAPPPPAPPGGHQMPPPQQQQQQNAAIGRDDSAQPQLPDLSLQGQHSWYVTSHARPTYCNVCREALSGVTFHGLSCEVCKFRAHKRCAAKSPHNCKWTTLASVGLEVLEDEDGSPAMPHQWVEGNLPVSSRCWSCERACGSVLRLQDWRCLWCRATVHTACRAVYSIRCPLGLCRVSVIPPINLHTASSWPVGTGSDGESRSGGGGWGGGGGGGLWRGVKPVSCSPLLVFVNSKSGDNQGVKFLRRFKQLLNPAQVFDLMSPNGGPLLGLRLFSSFPTFRILVCGGDGSVSWVLSEIDRLRLHKQCQIGVLPLGTGNDLARVLGWGSVCDDDSQLPQLLEKYERATTKLLDRWSILTYEGPLPMPRKLSQPYSSVGGNQQQQQHQQKSDADCTCSEKPLDHHRETTPEAIVAQRCHHEHYPMSLAVKEIGGGADLDDQQQPHQQQQQQQRHQQEQNKPVHHSGWDQSISRLEGSVVDHLSKILESDQHSVVISSARVLCETVRDFILKVQSKTECEEIEAKCSILNDKLDSLLKSLHEEEQAHTGQSASVAPSGRSSQQDSCDARSPTTSPSHSCSRHHINNNNNNNNNHNNNNNNNNTNNNNISRTTASSTMMVASETGTPGVVCLADSLNAASLFSTKMAGCSTVLQREALMCRANSLKKALRQIIEHTERAVDEQNALPDDWLRWATDDARTTTAAAAAGDRAAQRGVQRQHDGDGGGGGGGSGDYHAADEATEGRLYPDESRGGEPPTKKNEADDHDDDDDDVREQKGDTALTTIARLGKSDITCSLDAAAARPPAPVAEADKRKDSSTLRSAVSRSQKNRVEADAIAAQDRRAERAASFSSPDESSTTAAASTAAATGGGSSGGGNAGSSSSLRPQTLPILETTPDSPKLHGGYAPSSAPATVSGSSEHRSSLLLAGRSPASDGSGGETLSAGLTAGGGGGGGSGGCLLQLSSPTASRRISSGSTLKHIGNIGLQLAAAPSFASGAGGGGGSSSSGGGGGSSPSAPGGGGGGASGASGANLLQVPAGGARSPDVDVDRRVFPIINPLASLPAWPNLAGESSLVGKALLANADALCAAASPLMDIDDMNMDCFQEKCVMNNYFGIGLDAKIALEFHNKREEHPEKCRSRTKNLMWYGVLGGRELLNKTYKNLEQRVHLECDGHRIALPSLQGIVVLNIPSYGGGSNFWGGSKEDDVFFAPAMDDKILEVVAVFGTVQMAASRVINLQHHRIAQCRSVRITITGTEGVPVQVDGEAWLQPPGCVCIQHKNRTQILCRNRQFESSLKSWNEKQRRPSSGSQCGSKTAPAGSGSSSASYGSSSATTAAPAAAAASAAAASSTSPGSGVNSTGHQGANSSAARQPPPEASGAGVPALGPLSGSGHHPLDGPLSDDEAIQISAFIDAASHLVKVGQRTDQPRVRKSAKSGLVHRLSRLSCWSCGSGRAKTRSSTLALSTLEASPTERPRLHPHAHSYDHIDRLVVADAAGVIATTTTTPTPTTKRAATTAAAAAATTTTTTTTSSSTTAIFTTTTSSTAAAAARETVAAAIARSGHVNNHFRNESATQDNAHTSPINNDTNRSTNNRRNSSASSSNASDISGDTRSSPEERPKAKQGSPEGSKSV